MSDVLLLFKHHPEGTPSSGKPNGHTVNSEKHHHESLFETNDIGILKTDTIINDTIYTPSYPV